MPTALVAVGIGLALRLRWRLGLLVWLLPAALFAMVTVDHALYNEVANRPVIELPDVQVSEELADRFDIELPSVHEADVPGRLQDAWRTWGRGRFERLLLTLLLVAGMVLDVRRLRRARTTFPPLPAIRSAGRLHRAADSLAVSLRLSAARAGAMRRVTVGAVAETLRWLLNTVADIWHELVLSVVGATADPASAESPDGWAHDGATLPPPTSALPASLPPPSPVPPPAPPAPGRPPQRRRRGPSRLLATLYYLRVNRQLGQQAETRADRRRPRTGWRGIWHGLAGVGLLLVLLAAAADRSPLDMSSASAPVAARTPATTANPANSRPTTASDLVAEEAVGRGQGVGSVLARPGFLANLLQELGEWWSSLSFAEQMILIVGAAFLLSWGFGWAFLPTLGYVSVASAVPEHGRGAADFIRDPREATRRFFRELTPADVLWYVGSEAIGRLVPKGSSMVRNRLRRNVDEIIESADDRIRRSLDDGIDLDAPRRPKADEPSPDAPRRAPTGNPREDGRWITPGDEPGVPTRNHGKPFNRDYEDWVRTQAGGPHGQEFQHNSVNFDGIDSRRFDGTPGDVLLDAKGDYGQFVDPRTGDWQRYWGESRNPMKGLKGELKEAVRQVRAARGTPVEWRCAQEDVADLFNQAFQDDDELAGKITAVFVAPPEGMAPT